MNESQFSDVEISVLRAVQTEGSVDLYDLARIVGTGPKSVQEAVQNLSDERLVIVAANGVEVHCTPRGEEVVRDRR